MPTEFYSGDNDYRVQRWRIATARFAAAHFDDVEPQLVEHTLL